MDNTIYKDEIIDRVSAKLSKERIVVGGKKHAYRCKYHLRYTEIIIAKVLDAFWEVVADTVEDGDKVQIQHYISIFPKFATNGNVNRYCVKTKAMSKLKEACAKLTERKSD